MSITPEYLKDLMSGRGSLEITKIDTGETFACDMDNTISRSIEVSDFEPVKHIDGKYSFEATISIGEEAQQHLYDMIAESARQFYDAVEAAVCRIVKERWGLDGYDEQVWKDLIERKRLRLLFREEEDGTQSFYGIMANNRWLYGVDGRVYGKKGKEWQI